MCTIKRLTSSLASPAAAMSRSLATPEQFSRWFAIALLALVPGFVAQGQSQDEPAHAITVRGRVLDSHGLPVEAASVHLHLQGAPKPLTVVSNSNGEYRCSPPSAGLYTLRAEKAGYGVATVPPFELSSGQGKTIDLTLTPKADTESARSPAPAEFYDEPQFTVAGVTDTMSHGGHGSDTVSRTTQSLAREVAALDKPSPPVSASGSAPSTEALLREAAHEPGSFEANRRLGILRAQEGKPAQALPYLERAHQIRGDDYDTAAELARAYADAGKEQEAETTLRSLLAKHDKAELHHLLAGVEEKRKHPVEAVQEYQRAAELDPSEPNLFDWGTELLTHRALQPAIEVFAKGNRLFPQSARLLVGLGVAWYASGSSELAVKYVCQASDLNPADSNPYLVLGKLQSVQSTASQDIIDRLQRFAQLQPDNALANYYYAVSLWKQARASLPPETSSQVESLLEKAVRLDPKLATGFLQLGILYEDRGDLPRAISAFRSALAADRQLGEAHYRLAQAYRRTGEKLKAEQELASYKEISRHADEQAEREAREIPRFVYTLRDSKSQALPQ